MRSPKGVRPLGLPHLDPLGSSVEGELELPRVGPESSNGLGPGSLDVMLAFRSVVIRICCVIRKPTV